MLEIQGAQVDEIENNQVIAQAVDLANFLHENSDYAHSNHTETVEIARELSVHLTYDGDISDIIRRQRPNEPSIITAYRAESWQPVTAAFTSRISGYTDRVLDKKFWDVDAEGEIAKYLENMPIYGDFFEFMLRHLKPEMLRDPNAFVVVLSSKPINSETPANQLPIPVPMIVPSEYVIEHTERHLLAKGTERNIVRDGDNVYEGEVYWLFTDFSTYKAVQVGAQDDRNFQVEPWEVHNSGVLPAIQLGGRLSSQKSVLDFDAKPLWLSFLQPCLPWLNKYASLDSDEQAHYLLHIYLQKYEAKQDCSKCGGSGLVEIRYLSGTETSTCGHCSGSGVEPAGGIFNVLQVEPDANGAVGAPAGYIAPPTNIIENIGDKLQEWMRQAFGAVGLEFLLQNDNGRQTAEAKMLDRDETQAFLQSLAARLALVSNFVAEQMNFLRYSVALGDDLESSYWRISPKDTFTVETLEMTRMALEVAEQNNLHAEQKKQAAISYAAQQYGSESEKFKRIETILSLDKTYGMSADDLLQAVEDEILTQSEIRFSRQIAGLVDQAASIDKSFYELPILERKSVLENIFTAE